MKLNELIQKNRSEIIRITAKYGARNVRLFGSVARHEEGPTSDIDLLVAFDAGRSLFDHVALIQDLEDLLGRKVDVVSEGGLHWYIRDQILSEARPL